MATPRVSAGDSRVITRRWHRSAAIGLSLAAGVLLFLAADYVVSSRVLPDPDADVEWVPAAERPYLQGPDGWYTLKRAFNGRDYWGPDVYAVRTDAYGFRADEERTDKLGKARVIFLGDSFAYGLNGPWRDTFVGMYDLSVGNRIANAAVPSYSPTPYFHRYQEALKEGALESPHIVVVALDISDVHDEAGVWVDGEEHPKSLRAVMNDIGLVQAQREARAATGRGRLRGRLRFSRSIYRLLRYSLFELPNPAVFDQMTSRFTWDDWPTLDATPGALAGFSPLGVDGALERISTKLEAITQLAHANAAKVFIVIYPWPAQLKHQDRFSWSAYVSAICGKAACDGVIDTLPLFKTYAETHADWYQDLYVNGDVHFSPAGNRMIFEALVKGLPR